MILFFMRMFEFSTFLFSICVLVFVPLCCFVLNDNGEGHVVVIKTHLEPEQRAHLVPRNKNGRKKTKARNANNSAYEKNFQKKIARKDEVIKGLKQQLQLKDEEIARLKREKNKENERCKRMAKFECLVCAENVSTTHAFLYCGHRICKTCGDKIMEKRSPRCPFCRKETTGLIQIF